MTVLNYLKICWQVKYFLSRFYLEVFALFSLMERSLIWYYQLRFVSIFIPRYLTLLIGYSLLPYNFNFKLPSNFFYLDLKITISVFFTLSEILFAFNQLCKCFKSVLTSLFSFLIEFLGHKRLVSSAKGWTLPNFIAWLRSFIIYGQNRRVPRTDPLLMSQFKVNCLLEVALALRQLNLIHKEGP